MTQKLFNIILLGLMLIGFVWFVSTPAQRESYLTILSISQGDHESKDLGDTTSLTYKKIIPDNNSVRALARNRGFQHPQVNFCQEEGARNPAQSIKTAVFKWTDDQGVVNYSDNSPDDHSVTDKLKP